MIKSTCQALSDFAEIKKIYEEDESVPKLIKNLFLEMTNDLERIYRKAENIPIDGVEFMGENYQYLKISCIHCGESALLGQPVYHLKTCAMVVNGIEDFIPPEERSPAAGTDQDIKKKAMTEEEMRQRIEFLVDLLDRRETALHKILDWARAYPLVRFPEPDFNLAAKLLSEGGVSLGAVTASNCRHIIENVTETASWGLESIKCA